VAVGALYRRSSSFCIFRLVAGDAQTGAGAGIVKRRLQTDFDGRSWRFGVAIRAGLLWRLKWLFRLGGVVANLALTGHSGVGGMGKLHRTHGWTFQHRGRCRGLLANRRTANHRQGQADDQCCYRSGTLHAISPLAGVPGCRCRDSVTSAGRF
jgi:hypothetical protein